jgi:hypothetical protein
MRTVALYGDSVVLSSIAASLERCAGLWVVRSESVGDLKPDVAIFDLAAGQPDIALALWKAQPNLMVIGVDLSADKALVLSGKESLVLTLEDLVNVIEGHPASSRGASA